MEDSDKQLKNVLNTDQQKTYENSKMQAKEKMEKNRQGRRTKDQ